MKGWADLCGEISDGNTDGLSCATVVTFCNGLTVNCRGCCDAQAYMAAMGGVKCSGLGRINRHLSA